MLFIIFWINITGQQIVTPQPLAIKNQSSVGLDISATVSAVMNTTESGSTMKLVAADPTVPPEGGVASTGKEAYVYLEVAASALTGDDTDIDEAALAAEFAADDTWSGSKKTDALSTKATEYKKLGNLVAASQDDGEFEEYQEGSIALFRLAGTCVTTPKTPWTDKDGFTANIAFTFIPDGTSYSDAG